MVQQLLSAKDLKAQTDAPMMSTNTGAKPWYVSGWLPVNKGLPKASVAVPNAQPIGAIAWVNAPSPVQQAVSTAQKSPATQKDFTNAFSPKAAPTNQIPENIPVVKDNVDVDKWLSDLTSQLTEWVRAGKTINIDKLKSAYPEFSHVNNEVLQELTNQLSEGIKAGKTLNMDKLKQAYPELSGWQDSSIQWWLKGEAARMSPIDLWPKGEWINPIGRVAEIIDEQAQKIGTVDVTRWPEMALNQRIANLSPKEIAKYRENFNNLKRDHPVMARLFKVPKWSNLVWQLWNAIKWEYEDVWDEKEFQWYIYEQEKDYIDQLVGAGTDWPNVVNMDANIPWSAVKTASAVTRAITNPADTLAWLWKLIFTEEGHQAIIDRYGSREAFAKSMETDPIGVASDVLALIQWWASLTKWWATVTSKLAASAWATDFAAASSKFAAKAGGVANTAGAASNLWMDLLVPKWVNFLKDATKVADNASPMAKLPNTIANYGAAVISPLDSLVHVAKWAKDLLPTAEWVLQRMNRLTKSNQEKFQKVVGVSEWEWLNNNIWPKTPVQTVEALWERVKSNINEVDTALEQIEWGQKYTPVEYETKDGDIVKYEWDAVKDMAEDAVGYAERTGDPRAKVMQGILDKYNEGTATMTDINKLQRYYQANVRLGYFKDMTAWEKTARSTNIDSAVREWKFKVWEENGFDNFREINKDTQASMIILKALEKNEAGKLGNNAVTLTDWIVAAAALTNPEVLPAVIGKMVLQSNWFSKIYAQVLNKLNWHTTQAQKAADMAKISQMKTEKEFKEWLAEENKTAKQLRSKAEQEEFNAKTKALPSPENATKSNLGTDKNPIVSKWLQPKQVLEINNPDAPSSIRNSSSYVSGLPPKWQVEKWLKPKSESKWLTPKPTSKWLQPKVDKNLTSTPKEGTISSDLSATKEMKKYDDIVMTEAYSAPTYELYAKWTKAEFPEMTDIEIKDAYAIAQKWKSDPVSKALVDYKLAVTWGSAGELGNALLKTLETDKQLAPKIAEASKDIIKEQNIKEIYRYWDKEWYSRTTKPDEYFANWRPLQTMKVTPDVLDRIVYAEWAETKLWYEAFPNTGEGEIILKPKSTSKWLQPNKGLPEADTTTYYHWTTKAWKEWILKNWFKPSKEWIYWPWVYLSNDIWDTLKNWWETLKVKINVNKIKELWWFWDYKIDIWESNKWIKDNPDMLKWISTDTTPMKWWVSPRQSDIYKKYMKSKWYDWVYIKDKNYTLIFDPKNVNPIK